MKALTGHLTILEDVGRARGADGLYLVVSDSGREYLVDRRASRCECDDHFYRGVECAHLRGVDFALGERPIPRYEQVDAVDPQLGERLTNAAPVIDGPETAFFPEGTTEGSA